MTTVQGVSFLRKPDFAPPGQATRLLWLILEEGYRRDARIDFDAKYVNGRGSAQGTAFLGRKNIEQHESKRPLVVVVAQ